MSNTPLWSGTISSPTQLAAVISGEAGSNPASQFAVASVMYNRTQAPGFGSTIQSVVTPDQFLGYQTPNSNSLALANQLWSGQAPSGGNTGNALYFVSPLGGNSYGGVSGATGPATAGILSGGGNVGGNVFSDQWGSPSSSFQAPSYGGSGASLPNPTQTTDAYNGALGDMGQGAFNFSGAVAPGSAISATNPGSIAGLAVSSLPTMAQTPAAVAANLAGGMGAGVVSPAGLSSVTASGAPVNITDATQVGAQAGQNLSSAISNASTTGTSWISSLELSTTDWLVRGGLFLVAVALLFGAWSFYAADAGKQGATA